MANRLIEEQSPYLLQHAHNPVDWYPWGDEAFDRARREDKPLIVSIGYAACHWCHVMEHESFEDEATAGYMNAHFVCIKVDREEHPDVDHMYMDAVQAIGGSGGWPLNVFVTPERAPFYGGTYYPPRPAYNRPSWMQLLQRMHELWSGQRDEVMMQAEQVLKHLTPDLSPALSKGEGVAGPALPEKKSGWTSKGEGGVGNALDTCRKIADNLLQQADKVHGGFGNAPKFPGTMAISFLLEHYHFTGYAPALQHALLSLDAMIAGGIYDQLGGGFARYSTDREWLAPHFEKMLYDNALIVSALCDAYGITKDARYKTIIEETIAFAERELRDESGGYYCALDADSEGVEGKFYTWTWDEWIETFGGAQDDMFFGEAEDDRIAEAYFGVRREGNWEGTNILHVAGREEDLAVEYGLTKEEVRRRIDVVKRRLLAVRNKRVRPMTDDKCLLSWNALMNIAVVKAGVVFGETDPDMSERYLARGEAHGQWMLDAFDKNGELKHVWKNGVAKIPAKLDDYTYLVQALLQLGSATGNNKWVAKAVGLTDDVMKEFRSAGALFYYTSEQQKDIPVRKIDTYDGATPSANAFMAQNLWICGMCMERGAWIAQAGGMLHSMSDTTMRYSYSFGYWALLLQRHIAGQRTVICSGINAKEARKGMAMNYLPEAYLLTLEKEISEMPILENKFFADKMYIFVCSEHACLSPVSTVNEAVYLVKQ